MTGAVRKPLIPVAFALVTVLAAVAHLLAPGISPRTLVGVLDAAPQGLQERIVWELGLPRLLTALLTGAGLGVAGFLLQASLRNPLAAPEFTGVNPGAVLGLLAGMTLGLFPADSVTGALAAALLGGAAGGALSWTFTARGGADRLVVGGLLCSAVLAGLTTMLLAYRPDRFGNALRWLIGSAEGRVWDHLGFVGWWIPVWIALMWGCSAVFAVLAGGDDHANALGVPPHAARALALAGAVALTAGAASLAGAVAFVGLVAPHAARWLARGGPRAGVPAAALAGAVVLVAADALAQLLTRLVSGGALAQRLGVPTGVVTALTGAAVLIALARKERTA
ncbi:iron complex transport system permease protein [Streptosporangium becharense]|uniref:Iron complex transport system permease protein n=1 Tax=Streptosporangium becharense TaxID=1816182 RepID=A0A7W9IBE3_9ACTN|nr:iron chelate uptake ABC transporter family permease subunit [Streptosporangium becharense]MBB2910750.1 iron complex transport system permease protein [Streptosporangium becharense]MBB5817445.1 iron complex transport system permease protein [Streptosporangium becharense]